MMRGGVRHAVPIAQSGVGTLLDGRMRHLK